MADARLKPAVGRILVSTLPLQFAFGLVYSWGAVAPYVHRELGWPPVLLSAVFSATPVGYGTGILTGGFLADRLPPRRLCWTGIALLGVGFLAALAFPSGPTFVLLYAMLGLGLGGGIALAGSIAAGRHAIPGRPGYVGGLVTSAYAIAAPIQVPIAGFLAQSLGWLTALRILAGTGFALAAVTLAFMPAIPPPGVHHDESGRGRSPLALARRPRVWTGFLLELAATPLGAYAFVAAATYARSIGMAAAIATVVITGVAVGNALGRVGGGALSDRIGVDRVLAGVLVADVIAAALLFTASGPPLAMVAAIMAGIGFGVPAGVIGRIAEDAAPDAPNTAFGLVFAGFAVGAGSGSLVGAAIGGRGAWATLGAAALLGLVVVAVRVRLHRSRVA